MLMPMLPGELMLGCVGTVYKYIIYIYIYSKHDYVHICILVICPCSYFSSSWASWSHRLPQMPRYKQSDCERKQVHKRPWPFKGGKYITTLMFDSFIQYPELIYLQHFTKDIMGSTEPAAFHYPVFWVFQPTSLEFAKAFTSDLSLARRANLLSSGIPVACIGWHCWFISLWANSIIFSPT